MKELTIISGKGGTGKTTVTAAFAALARNAVFTDCDVDAADLHLLLDPSTRYREDFIAMRTPRIDQALCAECGECQARCRYNAIHLSFEQGYVIDRLACEHCGLCARVCPEWAISMEDSVSGEWLVSDSRHGTLVHARLGIGEDNSGKLVTRVRNEAKQIALSEGAALIINDGPPGIGCAVTAAITGVDLVLVVTEPTVSGLHDLERVADLCQHFRIPAVVCINKADINLEQSARMTHWCQERAIAVLATLPFDPAVPRALVARRSLVEVDQGPAALAVRELWQQVASRLELDPPGSDPI